MVPESANQPPFFLSSHRLLLADFLISPPLNETRSSTNSEKMIDLG